ncbi:MAG TPA: polysaccharide biosynthesis C-terminal domain-containing protein [Chitinophagaceae bacterium]|nr:polysaccharide biosynthesis C-terminal domain-containing protein [Chitinophagaceae bacterium]
MFDGSTKFRFLSLHFHIIRTYSAQLIAVASSFFCSVMGARMLGAYGQADWTLYTNAMLVMVLVGSAGLPAALVRFLASGKMQGQQFFPFLLRVLLVVALLWMGTAPWIMPRISSQFLPAFLEGNTGWVYLGLPVLLSIANSLMNAVLQSQQGFRKMAWLTLYNASFLLIWYAVRFFHIAEWETSVLFYLYVGQLAAMGIQSLLLFFMLRHWMPDVFHVRNFSIGSFIPLLQLAFMAFLTNGLQFLSYRADIWILSFFKGKVETGMYALGVSLAQMIWLYPAAMQTVLYSHFSASELSRPMFREVDRHIKNLLIYGLIAVFLALGLAYPATRFFFGQEFMSSAYIILILLAGVVPFCLSMPVSACFTASGYIRYNLHSAILGLVICLCGDWLLIPEFGMKGAAWASVFSYNATLAYMAWRYHKLKQETLQQTGEIGAE